MSEDPYTINPLAQEERIEKMEKDYDVQVRQPISVPDESFLYLYQPDRHMWKNVYRAVFTFERKVASQPILRLNLSTQALFF